MSDFVQHHVDLTVSEAVSQAVRSFATALAETPQFQTFEQAADALRSDLAAQQAIEAHKSKLQSLRMMLILKSVSDEDRSELARLRQVVADQPTVIDYVNAEEGIILLLRATADVVSEQICLPFAVSRSGCCG